MKRTMKGIVATGAALMLCALVSTSAFAGGSYGFGFGHRGGGRYWHGYRGWGGPRYSFSFGYCYAPPVYYYDPPPVVYQPYYYAPPVYYYSGGSFYCR